MKILLLANHSSPHTIKWATSLSERGLDIFILGLSNYDKNTLKDNPNITVQSLGFKESLVNSKLSLSKIVYLKAMPKLRDIIKKFQPDILHAHYATSYGLLGALSGFHPYIISVWGSDVFDFPNKSFLHKSLVKFALSRADRVLSTSHLMAKETRRYTNTPIEVIPFGIDLGSFIPQKAESLFDKSDIVIGTVKHLEDIYGIEYILKAFEILKKRHSTLPLKLLIVGGGALEQNLKKMAKELGIGKDTVFTGHVSYSEVPRYHNMISIFVSVSNSESFGVSVIEASACEKPVVVSNVGGLPEVVEDEVTGMIIPPRSPEKTAEAIEKLVLDENLRVMMGENGRQRVKKLYDLDSNVKQMINVYERTLQRQNK